jgi:hypothetical protein
MVHAKAILDGKTKSISPAVDGKNTIKIDNLEYALVFGYPAAKSLGDGDGSSTENAMGILGFVDLDETDFITTANTATSQTIQHQSAKDTTTCQLVYNDSAGANTRPIMANDTLTGC